MAIRMGAVVLALVVVVGCEAKDADDVGDDGTGESGDVGDGMGNCPGVNMYRDDWKLELDGIPLGDDVSTIVIGGHAVENNFMNQGDVEVRYDGPPATVSVELRRFAESTDLEAAQTSFEQFHLWTYSSAVMSPVGISPADDCSAGFHEGCQIRAWYDDEFQPIRLGADIRVTLPSGWPGKIEVFTEDPSSETPIRSDVTITGLSGSAEVELDAGEVEVELADSILEAPECGPELVEACWNYVDPGTQEPIPWDITCGCVEFGQLRVESRFERPANVTVDVPGDLWAIVDLENVQPGLALDSDPLCTAEVECSGFGSCDDLVYDEAMPWRRRTELNDPGDAAIEGAGYSINLVSSGCSGVGSDFSFESCSPEDAGPRGFLKVCSGCL
jgi:hypothetical protein